MSSNDSMSSSRLSQFGLYRTIDARTEQFLKLSRRRQLRQGCACAAVSSAVTVTVVVSVLFLCGGAAPAQPRGWLDLMNDSDPSLLEDRLRSSVHLDRAAIKLLPIFFDKLLEHDSSSPKYDTKSSTEYNIEKDVFSGTNIFSKIPSSRLLAIQYKSYPIVYIHSPRNTDNYSKLRKTREYERVMSYVDKMINEKVNFASSRLVRNKPHVESQNMIGNIITTPWPHKTTVSKKTKTMNVSKNYKYKQTPNVIQNSNIKLNNTKINYNNCKCKLQFGIMIDKLIKCIQKFSQDFMEHPCSNATNEKVKKKCIQNTHRPITLPINKKKTINYIQNIRLITTTSPARPIKKIITPSESPKGIFDISDSFLQNLFSLNQSKLNVKEFLTRLPSFYSIIDNNKTTTKNINVNSNKLLSKITAPFRTPNILNITLTKSKNINNNEIYTTLATTTTSSKPTTNKYTTHSTGKPTTVKHTTPTTGKYEDIFQAILFPEGNVFELTTKLPTSFKKGSVHYSSQNHYEISTEKYNYKQYDNVRSKNISDKSDDIRPPYTPKYPKIFPEEIVFEMFRKKHEKMINKKKSDSISKGNKHLKDSNKNIIGKLKELVSAKQMHPQGKNLYKKSSAQINKSLPKFNDDAQLHLKKQSTYERITEANLPIPEVITTTTTTPTTTSTTTTTTTSTTSTTSTTAAPPSSTLITLLTSDTSIQNFSDSQSKPEMTDTITQTVNIPILKDTTVPTQLLKYSHDQPMPEITIPIEKQKIERLTIFPKLKRKNPDNTEDAWNEFETDRPPSNENSEQDIKELTSTTIDSNITHTSTTDETKTEITNKIYENAINISPQSSTSHDSHGVWEEIQTTNNPVTYNSISIPVGRKSYLEISRGDWKQIEPHFNTDNMYDGLSELYE